MSKFRSFFLLGTVFVTGAVVLVIEIAGARLISAFYGSTIYVWSSLIATTLGFLAVGYYFGGRWATKRPSTRIFFGLIFLSGIAVTLVPNIYQAVLILSDALGARWGPLLAASLLFVLPVFFLGTLSPFAVRLIATFLDRVGATTGSVFFYSTLGSLFGALFTGFYLVPNFSLLAIFVASGLVLVALSLAGFFVFRNRGEKMGKTVGAALALLLLANVAPGYTHESQVPIAVLAHDQSFYADLKKVEREGIVCLAADGTTQSCRHSNGDPVFSYVREMARALDAYASGKERPLSVLLIGLGAGDLPALLPKDARVDIVEIDGKLSEFAENHFDFSLGENHTLTIDDARNFIRTTEKTYDVIVGDAYNGHVIPAHLLTEEFFALAHSRLSPEGFMVLNLNARPDDGDRTVASIAKTAGTTFPSVVARTRRGYKPDGIENILLYLSSDISHVPTVAGGDYVEIDVSDTERGVVLEDLKNGIELINTENDKLFREAMLRFGGYTIFFPEG